MNELARRQIRAASEQALRRAGVLGVVPTPLDAVSRAAGVTETIDLSQLPKDLFARRPNVLKRVIGAMLYRPRVVVVDRSQGHARGRFIEAHEISHKVIPWHEAVFRLDDEERVFGQTKKRVDLEADVGAAELLFQGDLFVRRALDFEVSISAPIGLASDFDASMAASIRHYAVYHPDPVAVIVAGRFARSNGAVPVWATHESPPFAARFGLAEGVFPGGIPASELSADPAGPIIHEALRFSDVAKGEVALSDQRGESHAFVMEAFDNGRMVLVMLVEKRASHTRGRSISVTAR